MFPKKSVWDADEDQWNRQEIGSASLSLLGPVETPFDLLQPDFSEKSPLTGHRLSRLQKDMDSTAHALGMASVSADPALLSGSSCL